MMKWSINSTIVERLIPKTLRNNMTVAEIRQHPFPDYVLELVCLERPLVVEVVNGQHHANERDKMRCGYPHAFSLPHPLPDPPLEGEGDFCPHDEERDCRTHDEEGDCRTHVDNRVTSYGSNLKFSPVGEG
jgi:hypothetical protein